MSWAVNWEFEGDSDGWVWRIVPDREINLSPVVTKHTHTQLYFREISGLLGESNVLTILTLLLNLTLTLTQKP